MKRLNKLIIILGLLLGIVSPLIAPGFAQESPTSTVDFVSGEVLVKFQPHVDREAAQRSLHSANMRVTKVSPYSGAIRVKVEPGHEQEMINKLLARGDVEFASVNRYVQALIDPNDQEYWRQWALPKIEAPAAWDISTGGSDVIVAIVDSGVDLDHPDLQDNIIPGHDFVNVDNVPDDDYGHGTHVAGIAAGIGNNTIGIAGVSWGTQIMPVKVLNAGGSGNQDDVADGIYHAVNNGAKIINLSLGGPRDYGKTCEETYTTMSPAVQHALNLGVLVIAAAGNSGTSSILCPAAMDGVVAVGSTTSYDSRSWFSNYGPELDIAAPGSGIYSTIPGGYGYNDGTSMAAPHVSGLAALLWSVSPSLTKEQVIDLIQNNAVDLGTPGWDQYFGHGRINALDSMQALSFQSSPSQLTLFLDDEQSQSSGIVQVTTLNTDVISWTAIISPTVSWLNVSPPISGTISAASSPMPITLLAQSTTLTYTDTPTTTTLVINGIDVIALGHFPA